MENLPILCAQTQSPERVSRGIYICSLKEVVGVDAGPSHQRRCYICLLINMQTRDFCPSYHFFKEDERHAHKFGNPRNGCSGQPACR